MTIVDKIINLIKRKRGQISLFELYDELPEHSEPSIRGNLNRYCKREDAIIRRVERGVYSFIEIIKINKIENEYLINYQNSYFNQEHEIHTFHKEYKSNVEFKEGTYINNTKFDDIQSLEEHYKSLQAILIKGDVKDILSRIDSNSMDLLITDYPYPVISGGTSNKKGTCSGMLSKNDGKIFDYNNIKLSEWLPEIYRIMKDGTQGYIFVNFLNLKDLMLECEKVGFQLHNLLVWDKGTCTPSRWYMKNAEYVLFIRKGKAKAINNNGCKTVHSFKNIVGNKIHETEKPVDLLSMYITNSSNEGDWIFDPFAGSGSTMASCLLNNRKCLSIEIDDKYIPRIVDRMRTILKTNKDTYRLA